MREEVAILTNNLDAVKVDDKKPIDFYDPVNPEDLKKKETEEAKDPNKFYPSEALLEFVFQIKHLADDDEAAYHFLAFLITKMPIAAIDYLQILVDWNLKGAHLASRGEHFMTLVRELDQERQLRFQWMVADKLAHNILEAQTTEEAAIIISNATVELSDTFKTIVQDDFKVFALKFFTEKDDTRVHTKGFISFVAGCVNPPGKPDSPIVQTIKFVQQRAKLILEMNPEPSNVWNLAAFNLLFCYPPLFDISKKPFVTK